MAYATSQAPPTIALLTYGTHDTIASDIQSTVSDVARKRGGNALCSPGGSPNDQTTSAAMSRDTLGLSVPLGLVSGVADFVREVSIELQPGTQRQDREVLGAPGASPRTTDKIRGACPWWWSRVQRATNG
jgi:hypothetical protein